MSHKPSGANCHLAWRWGQPWEPKGVKRRRLFTAALSEPWSNGQTEGQIIKLKLVKRQMYGRAKLDLLRARLVPSEWSDLHQI